MCRGDHSPPGGSQRGKSYRKTACRESLSFHIVQADFISRKGEMIAIPGKKKRLWCGPSEGKQTRSGILGCVKGELEDPLHLMNYAGGLATGPFLRGTTVKCAPARRDRREVRGGEGMLRFRGERGMVRVPPLRGRRTSLRGVEEDAPSWGSEKGRLSKHEGRKKMEGGETFQRKKGTRGERRIEMFS